MTAVPEYREWRPAPELAGHVACPWAGRLADDGTPFTDRVLPDACIDLIWDGRRLFVAGPDTGPVPITREPGGTFAGLRFRPGLAPTVLGVPAAALLDQRVDAADLWGAAAVTEVADRVAGAATLRDAAMVLERAVIERLPYAAPADELVSGVVTALQAAPQRGPITVAELADRLGVTDRQLHRRCIAAVGYGPKVLDRVLRFRRFLHLAEAHDRSSAGIGPGGGRPGDRGADDREQGGGGPGGGREAGGFALPRGIAALAAAAGYADQSHLTRECRRLAGTTPARLLAANVRSVQDRRAPAG
jgi:AraC-like DNA-binding protein